MGAWHLMRLRRSGGERHASAARRCIESLGLPAPVAGGTPLHRLAPGVFEIERRWFAPFPAEHDPGLTVVHLLGLGEHLHSPLPGLERLCMAEPRLAAYRHLIVDIPDDRAAYKSASAFSVHHWHALRPVLESIDGSTLLIGLGRSAPAAIDIAPWLADLDGRRVGVVALSLPVTLTPTTSPVLRDVLALQPIVTRFERADRDLPAALLRPIDWLLRRVAAIVSGYCLAELDTDSGPAVRWAAWDITQRQPASMLSRLCLELRLWQDQHGAREGGGLTRAADRLARHPSVSWTALWGANDRWVSGGDSLADCQQACSAARVPETRVDVGLLPGWGHAVGRDSRGDYGQLAAHLLKACERTASQVRPVRSSHIRMTQAGASESQPGRRIRPA